MPTPETRDAALDPVKMLADVVNEAKRLWHGDYQTGEDELAALQRLIDRTREVQRILRESRTPPAGPVVWIAVEGGDGTTWITERQPVMEDDGTATMKGVMTLADDWIAAALNLAPGECARVRLVREG